eukprot:1855587-Pleurochrysis_carterae.AAC.1
MQSLVYTAAATAALAVISAQQRCPHCYTSLLPSNLSERPREAHGVLSPHSHDRDLILVQRVQNA